MIWLLHAFTVLAACAGAVFFLAGTVGLLRFPDPLTRLHALTKVDNLGLGLIVLALLPRASDPPTALKLISCWLLVQLSGAVVTQLLARVALPGSSENGQRR
jgi:multicomponent Na+:H+ antiporter subunit G